MMKITERFISKKQLWVIAISIYALIGIAFLYSDVIRFNYSYTSSTWINSKTAINASLNSSNRSRVTISGIKKVSATLSKKSKPLIMLWTSWFLSDWSLPGGKCDHGLICLYSTDKKRFKEADAVLFHGSTDDIKDTSKFPNIEEKPKNQVWVYHNLENPVLTGKLGGSLSAKHSNVFNVINSYTHDSHIPYSYGIIKKGTFSNKFDPRKNYAKGKTKLIAWASSRCYPGRTNFVKKLNHYVDIDMYGECGSLTCDRFQPCWNQIANEHKFYLSFENYICKDYVTEKFYYNGLRMGMVPIVVGGANYTNSAVAPPFSFINALDFKNAKQLAAYIHEVAINDTLYNSYFAWRSSYDVSVTDTPDAICDVCEKLHEKQWVSQNSNHTISDLSKVLTDEKRFCIDYPQNMDDFNVQKFPWL